MALPFQKPSNVIRLFKKNVLMSGLSVVISSIVFFMDHVVLCDPSTDTVDTESKGSRKKLIYSILICVGIVGSFLLIGYFITPGNSGSAESTEEVIRYTLVRLPDPDSEESRAAVRATRDFLKSLGESLSDSSDGEK